MLHSEHGTTQSNPGQYTLQSEKQTTLPNYSELGRKGASLPQMSLWLPPDCGCWLPQIRERLGISLGERLPTLVPVTHAMMCMNCGCDFSLTVRRHHCHACGKVSGRRGKGVLGKGRTCPCPWGSGSQNKMSSRPPREVELVPVRFTEIYQSWPVPGPFRYRHAMLKTLEFTIMVVGGKSVTSWVRALARRHSAAQPGKAGVHMAQNSWESWTPRGR